MTAQEQQMLQGLIDRVRNTSLPEKDAEAEQTLQSGLGQNPDALYILAQTVLVQEYALRQAQQQLAQLRSQNEQLQQQAAASPKHTSFLGSLLGREEDAPRQSAAPPPPPPPPPQSGASSNQPGYTPVPNYPGATPASAPAPYGQPGYGQPAGYGFPAPGGGGFLRSALQTATGIAAGALAFEGIEDLMHGFGHAGGYGSGFMPMGGGFGGGFGNEAPREEIINNYYGNAGSAGAGFDAGLGGSSSADIPTLDQNSGNNNDVWNQSENVNPSQDAASFDSADTGSGFDDPDTADTGSFGDDSASIDDSSAGFDDNSGGFDDSGSGDNSGF